MPRPHHIACVLFDFDGVIVDSEPVGAERNVEVFASLGVEVSYDEMLGLVGKDGRREIPEILARHGSALGFDDFIEARKRWECGRGSIYLDERLELMLGVSELLDSLRDRGIATGLVSTTRAPRLLEGLNRFRLVSRFDVIVTGDMVTHCKPDPEPYQRAMKLLDATPDQTVIFDDSPTGIAAGVASGAYTIGFAGSRVRLDTSAADERLDSFVGFSLFEEAPRA